MPPPFPPRRLSDLADGSTPTGSAPLVFLSGATASWHTNKGTGGGFTENGALTDAATDPPASGAVSPSASGSLSSAAATVAGAAAITGRVASGRSEEHTSELQSLMRISYAVF